MGERRGDGQGRDGSGGPEFRRVRSSPTPPERGGPARGGPRRPLTPAPAVRRRRVTLLLAGALSVLVLLASGTAWALTGWMSGNLNRFDVFGALGDRPDNGPEGSLDFLVIGSDSREGMDGAAKSDLGVGSADGQRADTMMLVHLNASRDAVTVVGIPRDSWVDVPGEGENKINAAYAYGGPQLAVQTVEAATDVRIDHYVEIDFSGFVDVVDALDGIEVCLPEPIQDEKAQLDMAAGTHQVDGREALAFARTRKTSGGDLDRIDRQQQVMAALLDKALSSDTLSDPARFSAFLDTALSSVTVDRELDTAAINRLGGQLRSIGLEDVSFTQVPVDDPAFWTPHGDVAVTWDRPAAAEMFARISADEPLEGTEGGGEGGGSGGGGGPRPQDVTVQVFNGIGTPGLGNEAADALAAQGFSVPGQAQNWSSRDVETTTVRHAPDAEAEAELVASALPGAELEADPTAGEEVQVVLGFDFTEVGEVEGGASPAAPSPGGSGGGSAPKSGAENVCG
ncbi:LCP family protein [Nocardiopsis potens]|uniref:LCP family protein n=1 Tax=Nocardiopsis potens TaxID=1246458 RepID=UPI00059508EB|nr:LCP family protein [Nocardiopsis potens]